MYVNKYTPTPGNDGRRFETVLTSQGRERGKIKRSSKVVAIFSSLGWWTAAHVFVYCYFCLILM